MSTLNTPSNHDIERGHWQRYDSKQSLLLWIGWFCFVALTVFAWQVMNKDTIWYFVTDSPNQLADISSRMWPPRWSYLDSLWAPLWDTINIATLGTLLGIVLAFPVAFFSCEKYHTECNLLTPYRSVYYCCEPFN